MAQKSIVILCGGGPAPGINTVISSITRVFGDDGYRVLGLHGGYSTLFSERPDFEVLNFEFADEISSRGGSALKMSRYKPKNEEFRTDFFIKENIKLLVTIGGDDTASTANRITKHLVENKVDIQNIHVPKTIDNDLPLPDEIPTFGYQSATDEGVKIAGTVYEDARTSFKWFIVSAMGREAGHLAFGIGTACHYPMIIIPEMFNKTQVSFNKIIRLVISSMVKRRIIGINYGAAVISEGVFHFFDNEEIIETGINFTYDDHGHPELGNVSKAHIFNMLVQRKLIELNIDIKSRPVELGYEIRCIRPVAFDLIYCTNLGIGVKLLFEQGKTACMVTLDQEGKISPLFLKDVEDEHGKVKPRLVNINLEKTQIIFRHNLHYLTENDYEAARKYLPDPENYDFYKILNW